MQALSSYDYTEQPVDSGLIPFTGDVQPTQLASTTTKTVSGMIQLGNEADPFQGAPPVVDYYTPPTTDDNPFPLPTTVESQTPIQTLGGTSAPPTTGFVNDVFPLGGTTGITTIEGSPIPSNPNVVQANPLAEVNSLLGLFTQGFGSGQMNAGITQPTQPAVTVIPPTQYDQTSENSKVVIYLAIIGIAVTVGLYWYSRKKK